MASISHRILDMHQPHLKLSTKTQNFFFREHFVAIFARANDRYLVRINQHSKKPDLNHHLVSELRNRISEVLGEQKTTELIEGQF